MIKLNFINTAIRVCLDSTEGGCLSGLIYSRLLTEPILFSDTGNLVLKIEEILDGQNFPQAFQRARMFNTKKTTSPFVVKDPTDGLSAETCDAAVGQKTTFVIHVFSRRSSTWQGNIDWLDGSPQESFTSDLEFIKIIDNRVSANK